MIDLDFKPLACCWVHRKGQAQGLLAMLVPSSPNMWRIANNCFSSDASSGVIRVFDGRGEGRPLHVVERLHRFPVHIMTVSDIPDV